MEQAKKIASVSINPEVHKESFRLANYHGFKSFSHLVESLLIEWLTENSTEWNEKTKQWDLIREMGESKEKTT